MKHIDLFQTEEIASEMLGINYDNLASDSTIVQDMLIDLYKIDLDTFGEILNALNKINLIRIKK